MPKVDSLIMNWLGNLTKFEIFFNKKSGFYVKNCPAEITQYSEHFINKGKELSNFINAFKVALLHAEDVLTKSEQVLLVKFTITSNTYTTVTNQDPGQYSKDKNHPMSKFLGSFGESMSGIGLSIDYRRAKKIIRGEEVKYYPHTFEGKRWHNGILTVKEGEIAVPYSEERETTLKAIQSKMIDMVKNLTWFFSMKPELMSNILQSGNLNILSQPIGLEDGKKD